jgi:amidase
VRGAYEEASALLASLGHEVEDIQAPFGPEVVPLFETLWYSTSTLTPVAAADEDRLLPLTRYLRERGKATSAADLIFAQAYLQFMVRRAWQTLNEFDAVLTPTLAWPPVPVGYFEEVGAAGELRAAEAVHALRGDVQRHRAARGERAAALDRRRAADRGHAGRADG